MEFWKSGGTAAVACEKTVKQNDMANGAVLELLTPCPVHDVPKGTRWAVYRAPAQEGVSAEQVYDSLWSAIGATGRHLSVAHHENSIFALVEKSGQSVIPAEPFAAEAMYQIAKPNGGGATRNAVAAFLRAWFQGPTEVVSNFALAEGEGVAIEDLYADTRDLPDRDFELAMGQAKLNADTTSDRGMVKCGAHLRKLRTFDKNEEKARQAVLNDDCYCAVGPEGLHMPTDFLHVEAWMGETWSLEGGRQPMTFLHWLNSPEHLERTAVVYGESNTGKTAVLNATARTLAIRYQEEQPYYLCSGTVNDLRPAHRKGLLKKGVPRIIEDYAPRGNPNGKRQALAEYLVNLLNVKDGGKIDTPGGHQLALPAAAPQLISTNRDFEEWISKFKTFSVKLKNAVSKRIVFFRLPSTPLVRAELRKRRQEDMCAMVAAGLERERKFLRATGRDDASTAAAPSELGDAATTASSSGGRSPVESSEADNPVSTGDSSPASSPGVSSALPSEDVAEEEEEEEDNESVAPSAIPEGAISSEDNTAWEQRKSHFKDTGKLLQPQLTFAEWMQERDLCKARKGDHTFRSEHFLFNIAFFCNTNRLWDVVTRELQEAIAGQGRLVQVAAIFLLRMAGSPRNEEKPGESGAAAIVAQLAAGEFPAQYVRTMPFTGRKTYRAVLNREELAIIAEDVVADLASVEDCESLPALCDLVRACIKRASEKHAGALAAMRAREKKKRDNTERKSTFHAVQIACDLFTLGLAKLADDGADCPLATGSAAGIKHVRRWEDSGATVRSLAAATGRAPHEVQTSLCEYNKYVKWWSGADNYKPRH